VPAGNLEPRRLDFLRLLRQAHDIIEVSYIDTNGREQIKSSRLAMDKLSSETDFSQDPKFTQARANKRYVSPVYFRRESEPYISLAIAGSGGSVTRPGPEPELGLVRSLRCSDCLSDVRKIWYPHLSSLGMRGPMRRREFITFLGSTVAGWPILARAQQPRGLRRIGVFMDLAEDDPEGQSRVALLKRGLAAFGWREGQNLRVEYRWAGGEVSRMKPLAAELVSIAPEVIVSSGAPTLKTLQQETRTIPLVFCQISDPVASGFVESLSRPGGNITGFTNFESAMVGKWVGTLKEIASQLARVAVVQDITIGTSMLKRFQTELPTIAMQLVIVGGRDAVDFERGIDAFANEPNGGLIVMPGPNTIRNRQAIIASAARHRIPAIYPYRFFAKEGGLISYGIIPSDNFRRAAAYVDGILKGAKPSDLPVQLPTKFELVINLKTAKALGLEAPPTLLARADEVIE